MIKLKSLGLKSTIATHYTYNTTTGIYATTPNYIQECYYREESGVIAGERLMVERFLIMSFASLSVTPNREDKVVVKGVTHKIVDIEQSLDSEFEDHFILTIQEYND